MGYIEQNLTQGEKVVFKTKVHLMDFLVSLLFIWLFFIPPILAIFRRISTELAVTNKRVIGKQGLFARHAVDSMLNKIGQIAIDQGPFGRIFNYGTVSVGSGGDQVSFRGIANPGKFKAAVTEQMEAYNEAKIQQQAEAIARGMKK